MNALLEEKEKCICLVCGDMYTDPKRLECGHVFCHQCLLEKNGLAECPDPDCRKVTVPDREKVALLKTDVDMVDRIRALLREGANAYGSKSMQKKANVGAVALSAGATHPGVICDHCCDVGLNGAVYFCGMCPNYVVCERCERLPRRIVHWSQHIFLKIKKHITSSSKDLREAMKSEANPEGHYIRDGKLMGDSQDYGNSVHKGSKCDSCDVQPIKGTRFKCGMCEDYNLCEKCEERSLEIHDEYHVFLVLPHACTDPPAGRLIPYELFNRNDEE